MKFDKKFFILTVILTISFSIGLIGYKRFALTSSAFNKTQSGDSIKRKNRNREHGDIQKADQPHFFLDDKNLNQTSIVSEFSLTDHFGHAFKAANLADKIWVANFVFTQCRRNCPILNATMKTLHDHFKPTEKVGFLSFSVDPENDTPEVTKAYLERFSVDLKRWYFLTGSWADLRKIFIYDFSFTVPEEPIFHTDRLVLIDSNKRIRGYYAGLVNNEVEQLVTDINKLLQPSK